MLVLTQKVNETIIITAPTGEEILIYTTRISPNVTKLAIKAPKSYIIDREKIYLAKREKENAE